MQPNLEEPPRPPDKAQLFVDMADRIGRNPSADFGGAFLIVPPEGDHISTLILDSDRNLSQFWSLVKARAELALAQIQELERGMWKGR